LLSPSWRRHRKTAGAGGPTAKPNLRKAGELERRSLACPFQAWENPEVKRFTPIADFEALDLFETHLMQAFAV